MTGPLTGEHHVRSSVPAVQYVTERVRQGRCRGEGGGRASKPNSTFGEIAGSWGAVAGRPTTVCCSEPGKGPPNGGF